MKIDLSGKVAVVSGSTRGIGFATARGLGESGAAVVVNGRTQAAVDQAVANLQHLVTPVQVRGIAADIGTAQGCDFLVTAVPECDILINNLGIYGSADFFKIPDSDWARYFDINVMSGIRLSRAYLPGMMQRGWGRIVFISSESAVNIPPDMIHYGLTKTAQLSVSRGLAKLAAGSGVTVNAVLPGPTRETIDDNGVAFVQSMRPSLNHSATGHDRRGCRHGYLHRFARSVRNHRCGPAGRRWSRRHNHLRGCRGNGAGAGTAQPGRDEAR